MYNKVVSGVAAALLMTLAEHGSAAPVQYDFTAINISALFLGTSAPQNSISGSYVLDGTTLTNFNLSIGSQLYTTENTSIQWQTNSNSYILGGVASGIDGMNGFADDFVFLVRPGYFNEFTYSVYGVNDYFRSSNVSITSSTPAVPLPSSLPLFLSGIIGTVVAHRKRRSAQALKQ